jgi:hypothetical protein
MRSPLSNWRLAAVVLLIAAADSGIAQPRGVTPQPKPPVPTAVRLEISNADLHVLDDVTIHVPTFDAWMVPQPGQTVSLDDKKTFTMQILQGKTYLKDKDLAALLNDYLLPHAKAPLSNISLHFNGQTVEVKGDLKKGIRVPFSGKAQLDRTPEGEIRLHFTSITAAGILKKGLMDALGIKLSSVAQPQKESRFRIEGDDILFPIHALFPPPRVYGKLTAVSIEGDSLVQVFGDPDAPLPPPRTPAPNYIYFHGGTMRFGKMTMADVDLELVDMEPKTPFDFDLTHYYEQLEYGYSKSLPGFGLLVYAPDYRTIRNKEGGMSASGPSSR